MVHLGGHLEVLGPIEGLCNGSCSSFSQTCILILSKIYKRSISSQRMYQSLMKETHVFGFQPFCPAPYEMKKVPSLNSWMNRERLSMSLPHCTVFPVRQPSDYLVHHQWRGWKQKPSEDFGRSPFGEQWRIKIDGAWLCLPSHTISPVTDSFLGCFPFFKLGVVTCVLNLFALTGSSSQTGTCRGEEKATLVVSELWSNRNVGKDK